MDYLTSKPSPIKKFSPGDRVMCIDDHFDLPPALADQNLILPSRGILYEVRTSYRIPRTYGITLVEIVNKKLPNSQVLIKGEPELQEIVFNQDRFIYG